MRFTHLPHLADGSPPPSDRVVITTRDDLVLDSGDILGVKPHTRLKEKFIDCCVAGGRTHGEALFARLAVLEQLPDARELALGSQQAVAA